MLSFKACRPFSLLASDNAAFAAQFQKHIADPFMFRQQADTQRHMAFKTDYEKAFAQKVEQTMFLPGEIGPIKQKKVNVLIKELNSLSCDEQNYLKYRLRHHMTNQVQTSALQIDGKSGAVTSMLSFPLLNEQLMRQQNTVAALYLQGEEALERVFRACGSNLSGSGEPQEAQVEEQKEESKEEEKVVEKTNFDVVLSAIDPKNKIKVIKEVRSLCGLGLKEAKEAVEKLPGVLVKQAIKEDADKFKQVLEELGCTVELK